MNSSWGQKESQQANFIEHLLSFISLGGFSSEKLCGSLEKLFHFVRLLPSASSYIQIIALV